MINTTSKTDFNIIEKFSSYSNLIRFFAIMTRYKNFKLNIIVLDFKYEAVTLLIRGTRENLCHAGVEKVISQFREKIWIFSVRKIVKSIIDKCVIFKRFNVKSIKAGLPPSPVHRVKDASVFEVTGIDFASPVYFCGQKMVWICLFICAIYRAVHLELVTSLSTNEFLGCLHSFIAR